MSANYNTSLFGSSMMENEEKKQSDPYAEFSQFQVENDPYSEFSQFEVTEKTKKPSEKSAKESESLFDRFGKALAMQAKTNAPDDLKAFTPLLSGATIGLSEKIPGLEVPQEYPKEYSELMKMIGSVAPIEGLFLLNKPLRILAEKSPVAAKQLGSLARIVQAGMVGAEYKTIQDVVEKGELPSEDDIITHGAEWALLDAAFQATGAAGNFAKSLFSKSKSTGESSFRLLNDTITRLRNEGVDFSQPEIVSAKALSVLEDLPVPSGSEKKIAIPEKKLSKTEQAAQQAINESNVTPSDLKEKKVDELFFDTIDDIHQQEPSKPTLEIAEDLKQEAEKPLPTEELDRFHQRPESTQQVGRDIKESVNQQLERAREEYNPLYQQAQEEAPYVTAETSSIAQVAARSLQNLESLATRPAGYQNVINTILSVFRDIGFQVQRDEQGRFLNAVGSPGQTPVSNLMELGKRLNEIVEYDILEPSIKNSLKPITNRVKNTIRNSLENSSPEAYEAFVEAERRFADTAQKFGKPPIVKIRKEHYVEQIPQEAIKPTSIDDLAQILTPGQFRQIEREILENINAKSYNEARKAFSEIGNKFSPEGRQMARRILENKRPKPVTVLNRNELEDSIVNKLSKPGRPTSLINYWKTKAGNQEIKNALKNNPNRERIFQYLEKQSMFDFASEFVDSSGKIDFKSFEKFLKKETNINAIRDIGGQEAVDFFLQIGRTRKALERRIELFNKTIERQARSYKSDRQFYERSREALEKAKTTKSIEVAKKHFSEASERLADRKKTIKQQNGDSLGDKILQKMARKQAPTFFAMEDFFNELGIPGKTLLGILGLHNLGFLKAGASYAVGKLLYKLAKKKAIRNKFSKAVSSESRNPSEMFALFKDVELSLDED